MEKHDQLRILFHRYLNNQCTREDVKRLMEYFRLEKESDALKQLILDQLASAEKDSAHPGPLQRAIQKTDEHIYQTIIKEETSKSPHLRTWLQVAAAAAVLVLAGVGWHFFHSGKMDQAVLQSKYGEDISPGGDRATLTLADGRSILLDETGAGQIAEETGAIVTKTKDGQLTYTVAPEAKVKYHTITTPRGGQYQVILPDSTHVWLNAASSITYPTIFTTAERRVEITGEAYFEVAHNKQKPFYVKTGNQEVQVLGTHFNINAYEDEERIKTTLLEGRILVRTGGQATRNNLAYRQAGKQETTLPTLPTGQAGGRQENKKLLKPGQQSIVHPVSDHISINSVDPETAVGWKNGYFIFNHEDIQSLMRKIARWYDVEVVYEGDIPEVSLGGDISRFEKVSQILDVLERTGTVHFKIEGRRITVMQ